MTPATDRGAAVVAAGGSCRFGRYVFAHGLVGTGPDCASQLRGAMARLDATLRAAGSELSRVVRITYYVRDATQLPPDARGAWFVDCWPRSTVVQVGSLPEDVLVELEATATACDP
jgi:enamine deaminase RidA (YjgF/YER057c/UK114 family)